MNFEEKVEVWKLIPRHQHFLLEISSILWERSKPVSNLFLSAVTLCIYSPRITIFQRVDTRLNQLYSENTNFASLQACANPSNFPLIIPWYFVPYQIRQMLMSTDNSGSTVLMAAFNSRNTETFRSALECTMEQLDSPQVFSRRIWTDYNSQCRRDRLDTRRRFSANVPLGPGFLEQFL